MQEIFWFLVFFVMIRFYILMIVGFMKKKRLINNSRKTLSDIVPQVIMEGNDLTLVGSGYTTLVCKQISTALNKKGIAAEVIEVSVLNPLNVIPIVNSVRKTGALFVIDGSWKNCGFAGEIIASVTENIEIERLKKSPKRYTLPDAPAPSSAPLEKAYYFDIEKITQEIIGSLTK